MRSSCLGSDKRCGSLAIGSAPRAVLHRELPVIDGSLELRVTPLVMPHLAARQISSISAVSRKSFNLRLFRLLAHSVAARLI